jgi:hypothetical protein
MQKYYKRIICFSLPYISQIDVIAYTNRRYACEPPFLHFPGTDRQDGVAAWQSHFFWQNKYQKGDCFGKNRLAMTFVRREICFKPKPRLGCPARARF